MGDKADDIMAGFCVIEEKKELYMQVSRTSLTDISCRSHIKRNRRWRKNKTFKCNFCEGHRRIKMRCVPHVKQLISTVKKSVILVLCADQRSPLMHSPQTPRSEGGVSRGGDTELRPTDIDRWTMSGRNLLQVGYWGRCD